ncbi:hypothetical protein [Sodalis sp. dw_96]|uniref:hypothetical protein n=1 Tax=Sodalis sp. dw_96 TaxID=2719794 RepID=UPI001BD33119|nr:hypothetical protein [Sodalis sp. dw_96]
MLTTDNIQSNASIPGRKDEGNNNKTPLLEKFNSIKNINNNGATVDDITIDVQLGNNDADTVGNEIPAAFPARPTSGKVDWGKSVLSWGTKIITLMAGLMGGGAIGYYLRYGNAGEHGNHWRSALPANERQELSEILAIVHNDSVGDFLSGAPREMRFTEALIRAFAHIRVLNNVSDTPSIPPPAADNNLLFPTTALIRNTDLSWQNSRESYRPSTMKYPSSPPIFFTSKPDKSQRRKQKKRIAAERLRVNTARMKRGGQTEMGYSPAVECIFKSNKLNYWMRMFNNKLRYSILNIELNKGTWSSNYALMSDTYFEHANKSVRIPPARKSPQVGDRWLHTYGLSREFLGTSENMNRDLIDTMLSEIIYRKFGLSLSSEQFSRMVELNSTYKRDPQDNNEPLKHFFHGSYPVREIFLKEPYKYFFELSPSGKKHFTVLNTTIKESDADNLLSYLEFIINGETPNVMDEFYHILKFISASQDIDDAYIVMAKNRLVAALFPIINDVLYQEVRNIVEHWMDGLIEEKLVGFSTSEGRFMVPGIVAITEPTGGILISLATGALYLWTPNDVSHELKSFICGHLSVQQQEWFESVSITPYLDVDACVLYPAIILMASTDIWHDLKNLDIEKLDEHLDYHSLAIAGLTDSNHDPALQQRLLAAANAVSILAFFIAGGSPAGCVAIMLGNLAAGVSNAIYLQRALDEQDPQKRGEAWHSALFSLFITGLGGAGDLYRLIKAEGSQGYALLNGAVTQLQQVLGRGTLAEEAETFIQGDARERAVMLLKGLLSDTDTPFDMFGKNSVEAMVKLLRMCGRISDAQYQYVLENSAISDILGQKIPIADKDLLPSIPAGNVIAILDNDSHELRLLLLCLGDNRFGGYNLQELEQTIPSSGWQVVNNHHFRFINDELMLKNGNSATAYVEKFHAELIAPVEAELIERDSAIATKFRRYCNLYKFNNNIEGLLNGVERFALNNGFDDIQYRALFIFDPRLENHTIRHYVVVAKRGACNYILEPHAENISFLKLPDIEDVAILTEEQWGESFKNSETGALVTYKDFATEQMALDYKHTFNIYGDNEKLLSSPPGFIELMAPSAPITFSMFMSHYDGVERQLLLQKKVRGIITKDRKSKNDYEFILSVLKNINALTNAHKEQLLTLYRDNPQSAIKGIINDPVPVESFNDMLRIEPGKLVRLTEMDDGAISHIMMCVGNGRFASMNNSILDSGLTDEKRILIGEQLGVFHEGTLCSYDQNNRFIVEKGDFSTLKVPHKSLMEIAQDLDGRPDSEKNGIRFVLNMLVTGKKLVPQQADALERLATLMMSKLDGDILSTIKLNKFLAIDKYIDNNAELERVPAGKLVVFYTEEKDFHPLVSLGNNRFAGANNHLINHEIDANKIIISSQEIGDIVDGIRLNNQNNFKVALGDVNLEKTRISALLGPDGRIEYVRDGLNNLQMEIKAHGALASINHYDAIELSDIINGIHRSLYPDLPLNHIELISCFGALGGRRSSAQVISNRLGATVESYRGIISDSKSRKRGSGIMFMPRPGYGVERIRENERWHRRIHDFIEDALSLFGHLPFQRHSRAISEHTPFAMVVIDVVHFLRKEISASTLIRQYPDLMSEESLRQAALLANPTNREEMLIAAMLTIFYGNSDMTNAMDAYILSREYKNQPSGPVVVNGENLRHSLLWEDIEPSLATFRQLPSVIVENDLLSGSNIYVSMENDESDLKEYMIRVGSECNNKRLWPLLLANFFREQSESFPILAGVREQDILSMGFDFTQFHFYLNSWFRNDFSLQIDMVAAEISPEPCLPANYVHFAGRGRRVTDTRDDIGLGHSLLLEQEGWLALQVKETLAVERPSGPSHSAQDDAVTSPLQSMSRVVMTLVENNERFIMLQRKIPKEILSNPGEIAFFIAGEINKYTQSIKLGAKNSQDIIPVRSNLSNFVYGDPVALQKSWILINLIHND